MKKRLITISDIEKEIKIERNKNQHNGLKLNNSNLTLILFLKGKEKNFRLRILEHSRINYKNGGIYNEKRNCYYPKDLSESKNIAERNKLEKLFKKWEFKSL